MGRLRYLTAGESHGPVLTGTLEGLPARLPLTTDVIDRDLARRQLGHGRSVRQRIESDRARIVGGVRHGVTLGSPVALQVENRDHERWRDEMAVEAGARARRAVTVPRPGHADLAGGLKYGWSDDLRPVLERASARETAMRVAVGAVARALLHELDVEVGSHVVAIGEVRAETTAEVGLVTDVTDLRARADRSPVRCLDDAAAKAMVAAIDAARDEADSIGGVVEVIAAGVPVGLGSHVHWDRKIDGRLCAALASLPAVKGVEMGGGFSLAARRGSTTHDPIAHDGRRFTRGSNEAGGIEGGMTNGEPVLLRVAMKPISTLARPLPSVDWSSREPASAHVERADTCAVPALGVIAEAAVALVLADAVLECFGGDSIEELIERVARRREKER